MRRTSTISSKGQITVPIEIRKRLGVKEGDRVEFDFVDGAAVVRPVQTGENPFAQFAGCLGGATTIEEIVREERETRDPEGEYL